MYRCPILMEILTPKKGETVFTTARHNETREITRVDIFRFLHKSFDPSLFADFTHVQK